MFEQCGLDAIAFLRIVYVGFKISLMGCFNAIYLIPVYFYAQTTDSNRAVTDNLDKMSIANMNRGDPGMYGTVVASYIFYGYAMYLLSHEFHWYISKRHQYMSRLSPENYTVFVGGIPFRLRSQKALHNFFEDLFHDVLDVNIALRVEELDVLVQKREDLVSKLEHAANVFCSTGKRPLHSNLPLCGEKVDTINTLREKIIQANQRVSVALQGLEERYAKHEEALANPPVPPSARRSAKSLVRTGAFVSFRSIASTMTALQTVQHANPFHLSFASAPLPKDVCWSNVGLGHIRGHAASVLAGVLTAALCILWTVPVAIVASFSRVDSLKKMFPFIQSLAEDYTLIDEALAQVAPMALLLLIVILPMVLTVFARMEGHVAETAVRASLFAKLAFFKVVQIFLVSAVSGSIFDVLRELTTNPGPTIIDILGSKLPAQASYFMQLMIVQSSVNLGLELLRPTPCVLGWLRGLGPSLTAKEREAQWMGMPPLSDPGSLDQPTLLSDVLLQLVIVLAYAALSPVTCFVMAVCFGWAAVVFRHQFAFVYDPGSDSGGLLWPRAIRSVLRCMVLAEVIVLAVLSLKEGAAQAPLVLPLPVATVLLYRYLGQQHFTVAAHLPLEDCARADAANAPRVAAGELASGLYVQAALQRSKEPVDPDAIVAAAMRDSELSAIGVCDARPPEHEECPASHKALADAAECRPASPAVAPRGGGVGDGFEASPGGSEAAVGRAESPVSAQGRAEWERLLQAETPRRRV
jgi:calcium permeable stress-gated cation channel